MNLHVVSEYRCRNLHYQKGQVLQVTPDEASRLMADAPGCFSLEEKKAAPEKKTQEKKPQEKKAPKKPPADKMIHESIEK